MTNREAALKILDDIRDTYSKEPWAQSAIDWAQRELNCPEAQLRCPKCQGTRVREAGPPGYCACRDCETISLKMFFRNQRRDDDGY